MDKSGSNPWSIRPTKPRPKPAPQQALTGQTRGPSPPLTSLYRQSITFLVLKK